MTQVIGIAMGQGRAGCPFRRGSAATGSHGCPRLADPPTTAEGRLRDEHRSRIGARAGGRGRATGVRTAAGDAFGATRAVIARCDADAALRPPAREPATRSHRQDGASVTGAPRCRSISPFRSRRAGRETKRLAGTAMNHVTPGLDAVFACRQRGRAWPSARRGDGTSARPAADPRCKPGSRRQGAPALDPAAGAALARCKVATPPARSTPVTAPGPTTCASATPTGSRRDLARHIPNLESSILGRTATITGRPASR